MLRRSLSSLPNRINYRLINRGQFCFGTSTLNFDQVSRDALDRRIAEHYENEKRFIQITPETNVSVDMSGKDEGTIEYWDESSSFLSPGDSQMLSLNVSDLVMSPSVRINEIQREMAEKGFKVYRMGFGQSPFPVPSCMLNALKDNAHRNGLDDSDTGMGLYALRSAIANHFKVKNSTQNGGDPASLVMIGPGSKELIFLMQSVLYAELIVPSPSWVSYHPQARTLGRPNTWLQTSIKNHWKITPDELESHLKSSQGSTNRNKILILNYPNNPSGCTYTRQELIDLAIICKKYRLIVLSDEIYLPLVHEDPFMDQLNEYTSLRDFYPEGTIQLTGVSKWAGAGGWRLGAFVFPSNLQWLCTSMSVLANHSWGHVSLPIQYACIPAYDFKDHESRKEIERYLKIQCKVFSGLAHHGTQIFSQGGAKIVHPTGGFYIYPDWTDFSSKLPYSMNSNEFALWLLKETGISTLGGMCFGRPSSELTLKLSIVDFVGKDILDHWEDHFDQRFDEIDPRSGQMTRFLEAFCPNVLDGFKKLTQFMNDL